MAFGESYWISTTHTTSLTIKFSDAVPGQVSSAAAKSNFFLAPATYYGYLHPNDGLTPEANQPIEAWVGNRLCGKGQTKAVGEQIGFVVIVYADDSDRAGGCGASGRSVQFRINDQVLYPEVAWNSKRVTEQSLSVSPPLQVAQVGDSKKQPAKMDTIFLPVFTGP
ncbi:hypothetical protein KFU94_50155 [Chloroflexi bacterium TSY]|nr:hypothetical protein [Chloroflexi bacterium TSY]